MVDTLKSTERSQTPTQLAEAVRQFVEQPADPIEKRSGANVILLMGGGSHEATAKMAYELWREDPNRVIINTTLRGTFSPESANTIPESEDYFRILSYLKENDKDSRENMQVFHKPVSTDTIKELMNFLPILESAGIKTCKVIIVDTREHQQRAYRNALKLQKGIEFINCPAGEELDPTEPEVQLRLIQEIERYTLYKDMITPHIPFEVMRAVVSLKKHLVKTGVYRDLEHNARQTVKQEDQGRLYKKGETRVIG